MNTKTAVLGALGMLAAGTPLMAAIGSVNLDITSNGSNAPVMVNVDGTSNKTVPVSVAFTTTPNGSTGANRGAAGVAFSLVTGLPLIDQMPMTLAADFMNDADAVSSTAGAGFDLFLEEGAAADSGDGDPALDAIDVVGGFQAFPSPNFTRNKKGDPGDDLEKAGHGGAITIADGLIRVHKNTLAGTYTLTVTPVFALVWNHDPGGPLAEIAEESGDTLKIIVTGTGTGGGGTGGGGGGPGSGGPDDGMGGTDDGTGMTDDGMAGTDDDMTGTGGGPDMPDDDVAGTSDHDPMGMDDDGAVTTDDFGGNEVGNGNGSMDGNQPPSSGFAFCGVGANGFAFMSFAGLGLMRFGRGRPYPRTG